VLVTWSLNSAMNSLPKLTTYDSVHYYLIVGDEQCAVGSLSYLF
jgi:hypothetical protein